MGAVVRLAGAARLGEVRVGAVVWYNWRRPTGFFSDERMHDFDWSSAKVQAAYIGSSSFQYFMEHIQRNWRIWWGRASWPIFIIMHEEQTQTEYCEGAPVHSSAASARRRGPPLAIKPSSCCVAVRWQDNECAGPRQLRQLTWRSARAGAIYLHPSSSQVIVSSRCVFLVNSLLQISVNSILRATDFLGNF